MVGSTVYFFYVSYQMTISIYFKQTGWSLLEKRPFEKKSGSDWFPKTKPGPTWDFKWQYQYRYKFSTISIYIFYNMIKMLTLKSYHLHISNFFFFVAYMIAQKYKNIWHWFEGGKFNFWEERLGGVKYVTNVKGIHWISLIMFIEKEFGHQLWLYTVWKTNPYNCI